MHESFCVMLIIFLLLLVASVVRSEKSKDIVVASSETQSNITVHKENGQNRNSGTNLAPSSFEYIEENETLVVHNVPVRYDFIYPNSVCDCYEVCLYTNSSPCSSPESCPCLDFSVFSQLHTSCKKFRSVNNKCSRNLASGDCGTINQYFDDTLTVTAKERQSVTFSHVLNGFYCLELKCRSSGRVANEQLVERPFHVKTSKRIEDATCWTPEWKTYPQNDQVEVRLTLPATCSRKNLKFVLNLQKRTDGAQPLVSVSCPDVTIEGRERYASYTFPDLEPGNYSLVVLTIHPRCNVYQDKRECRTRLSNDIIITGVAPKEPAPLNPQSLCCQATDYLLIGLICGMAFILLVVVVIVYSRKRSCFGTRTSNDVLLLEPSAIKIRKKVPVLLLHANDDEALRKQAEHFSHVLNHVGFCEVSDIFDDSIFDAIATHGESFIPAMLNDPGVQVIIVTSKQAVRAQRSILSGVELEAQNNGSMFDLYVKALKTVMIMASGNVESYKRMHLIRFSDITHSDDLVSFITPFRCYVVPRNLRNLLCHLHGLADQDASEWDDKLGDDFYKEWSKVSCTKIRTSFDSSDSLLAT